MHFSSSLLSSTHPFQVGDNLTYTLHNGLGATSIRGQSIALPYYVLRHKLEDHDHGSAGIGWKDGECIIRTDWNSNYKSPSEKKVKPPPQRETCVDNKKVHYWLASPRRRSEFLSCFFAAVDSHCHNRHLCSRSPTIQPPFQTDNQQ